MLSPSDFHSMETLWTVDDKGDLIESKLDRQTGTVTTRIIKTEINQKEIINVKQKSDRENRSRPPLTR
jgi:hypothetical protein